jgi:uncharacterized protein involved in oxidation of intracellular sulfur
MKYLLILNDAPDSGERTYNGLRLANALAQQPGVELKLFLMGDAVAAARDRSSFSRDIAPLVDGLAKRDRPIGVCGSCIDARGIAVSDLARGAHRGSMEELTAWTVEADKVIVF